MRRSSLLLLLTVILGSVSTLPAQTPTPNRAKTEEPVLPGLWRCDLPGGTYEVMLRSVVSVSSHEYVVDGIARVTEVNVDTTGASFVRFYYLEPITPTTPSGLGQSALDRVQELTKEAAGRTSADQLWQKVVKNYPTTTHAHTVEYRLETKDQLNKLFSSIEKGFRTGQGSTIKLP